jgi:hypothetical protein
LSPLCRNRTEELSRALFLALAGRFPAASGSVFPLLEVVSGKFVQSFFHLLSSGAAERNRLSEGVGRAVPAMLNQMYVYLDGLLIAPFRLFEIPILGFYFGTFVLCAWCILIGELTFRLAARANSAHMNKIRAQAVKMHNLSIQAIELKDKESYRSCNKQANEAFGKYFFNMITQGAAYLWPVPFALAWMSTRFSQS